jgi:uncharacterized membrane protein
LVAASWEFGGLAALIASYVTITITIVAEPWWIDLANMIGPLSLLALLIAGAVRMARLQGDCTWTSLFWFRVATATYFGFGSFVPSIANDTTQLSMRAYFDWSVEQALTLNMIVAVSVLMVLLSSSLWLGSAQKPAPQPIENPDDRQLLIVGSLFGIVGFGVKLGINLPFILGMAGDDILPAAFGTIALLAPVSIYMLTRYSLRTMPALLPLTILMLMLDMSVGTLAFNKSEVILSLILFLLGFLSSGLTLWRNSVAIITVVVTFSQLVPIVDFGRAEMSRKYGSIGGGSGLAERLDIVVRYFNEPAPTVFDEEIQSSLSRLSYVNAGSLAIGLYDRGHDSPSLDNAWTVLVPRLVWPEKPILTDMGRDFNMIANNNPNSSSSPGIFAESYWLFGWSGVIGVMILLGIVFGQLSRFTLDVIQQSRWLRFPIVLLCMRMGFRVDGFLLTDYLGILVQLAVIFLAILAAEPLLTALLGLRAQSK